jgi:hypothetical protein
MLRESQLWVARSAVLVVGTSLVVGCASDKTPPPSERVDNPAAGTAEKPSNLSYGTITATIKKGVTTQIDLLEMFGGANVTTIDRDGTEVWMYERQSSMNDTAGSQQDKNFNAFVGGGAGGGGVVAGGGVSGGSKSSNDQRRTVNSIRTLTLVVKFNPDKTVKDYTTRASYF